VRGIICWIDLEYVNYMDRQRTQELDEAPARMRGAFADVLEE
jgi:hypothetical protein